MINKNYRLKLTNFKIKFKVLIRKFNNNYKFKIRFNFKIKKLKQSIPKNIMKLMKFNIDYMFMINGF